MFPISKDCPTQNWIANDAVNNSTIRLIPIRSWYFAPLRYNIPNIFRLVKEISKAYRYHDNIHIWEYYYPLSVLPIIYAAFSRKRRDKTILTTDGFVGYSYKPQEPGWLTPAFRIYTKLFGKFLFRIPRQMTTYGKSMLPYARQAGVPIQKLKVIPTGIHLEKFQNFDRRKLEQLQEEFRIKDKNKRNDKDEKIILFVGMLTERKGVDKVIKISQRLLEEGFKIKTLIVGDSHGRNIYPQMVKPELKDRIVFTGGRKEIPEFMQLADVLLLPSEGEGLPGVVMEAMASGLPVVATDEGCTPDLIEDGKEGFLVDLNSRYSNSYYSITLKKIIANDQLNNSIKNKARQKIKSLEWKIVSKKYLQLYSR